VASQRLDKVDGVRQAADSRDRVKHIARNNQLFVKKVMCVDD